VARIKTVCANCSATFVVVHDLDEDDYIEQYCPFCGEEHEQVEEDVLLNEDWD
jgi:hypothetical protein|tara:strand:+ start:41 stop:199 length:159 start_codon:yes stop_codon:yes gene_type:complete